MTSNWQIYRTTTPSIVLPGVADGKYEIQVVAIDAFGNRSDPFVPPTQEVDRSATGVIGIDGSVERVMDAAVVALGEWVVQASWAQVDNDSLSVAIRHSPDLSGATWSTSNPLVKGEAPNAEGQMLLPALTGTYLFRHQNGSGAVSATTSVVFHAPKTAMEVVATIDEAATGFTGVKRNCAFDASIQALRLNDEYWDDLALDDDFDALPGPIDEYGAPRVDTRTWDELAEDGNFDGLPGPIDDYGFDSRQAIYYFANNFDAGAVKDLQLSRIIRSRSRLVASTWDALVGPVDEILSIDNETAESGIVRLEYQDSHDALSSGLAGSWSGWKPLTRSIVRARSVRFRALLSVADINQDVVVSSLAVEVALAATSAGGFNTLGPGLSITDGQLNAAFLPVVDEPLTLYYAATVNLDMTALAGKMLTLNLAGNVTFTTSNRSAGKEVAIRIICDGTTRAFTFPGWIFTQSPATGPSSIAAGKTGILSVRCWGPADGDATAVYAVQG
jgi:hypothetical protein